MGWMRSTHIMKGNMLYSESTDVKVDWIKKIPPQKHLGWYSTRYLSGYRPGQ